MTKENTTHKNGDAWYSVLIAFELVVQNSTPSESVFEVRTVLLRAATEDAARRKAEELGCGQQQEYTNSLGERVASRFKEILDVCCLSWVDTFDEGTEVYYAHVSAEGLTEIKCALHRTFPEDMTLTSRPGNVPKPGKK